MYFKHFALLQTIVVFINLFGICFGEENSYLKYVEESPDFIMVEQDTNMLTKNWNTWIYMPWRYKWTIGTGDAGGRFCKEYGINGGFTDHGNPDTLEWLEKWNLKFYNDHTAAKGFLHLRGANTKNNFKKYQRNPRIVRQDREGKKSVDDKLMEKLKEIISMNVGKLKSSPMRIAYALDDEISWGAFVIPLPWRINEDDVTYEKWLKSYYGKENAPKPKYITPDATRKQLNRSLKYLDFSPLMDRITYNDSVWNNFLGDLVTHANTIDPETPCGFVGGQSPGMWGGYDYAKIMRKIQYIEAYDLGSSQEIIRSFNPNNSIPIVTTHFTMARPDAATDICWSWYYFAHGNRGIIGWVQRWFDGKEPKQWIKSYSATLKELGNVHGQKLVGAKWVHDKVAIYYSQASIQVSWILDSQSHGRTWVNRGSDYRLGTSHNVRKAWEYILSDSGLQYNFIAYNDVVVNGVPTEYKVLILPSVYALSDIEAKRIREFCENGGTIIADFCCGIFDHHGKGRSKGALDDLFGVTHTGNEKASDFFGDKYWVESDQDTQFFFKKYRDLLNSINCKMRDGYAIAEKNLGDVTVKEIGNGRAVYLNLSPQRYLQFREEETSDQAIRDIFLKEVYTAGVQPWVNITVNDKRPENIEATYWKKDGRIMVFIFLNSSKYVDPDKELRDQTIKINVKLPTNVKKIKNERKDQVIYDGPEFSFDFNPLEAIFFSFDSK